VRAFVIGVTLLVLLFGGFVVGVEAGTHPLEQAAATGSQTVTRVSVHAVTVKTPVISTVVDGRSQVIRVATTKTHMVVIYRNGKKIVTYEPAPTGGTGPQSAAAPTLYSVQTTTVTEPGTTVTEPPTTVTVTVTEPGTSGSTSPDSTTP
jgi:hypothetical protein